MQKNNTLKQAILAWDGKSAQEISQVYAQYSDKPDFVPALLSLLDCAECYKGLTWLLKKWLDNGANLSQPQTDQLLAKMHLLTGWESILQVLQSLSYLTISQAYQQSTEQFVRNALAHSNKFVRAWAYNGFYVLAKQYPAYQAEAQALFEMAMRDESASIKARVRHVMKAGFELIKEKKMIKMIMCLTRNPEISREAFMDYWQNSHGPFFMQNAHIMRAKKYVQSQLIDSPLNDGLQASRGMQGPYDGVAEVWFESEADLMEAMGTEAAADLGKLLLEDEQKFIDHAKSCAFVVNEVEF